MKIGRQIDWGELLIGSIVAGLFSTVFEFLLRRATPTLRRLKQVHLDYHWTALIQMGLTFVSVTTISLDALYNAASSVDPRFDVLMVVTVIQAVSMVCFVAGAVYQRRRLYKGIKFVNPSLFCLFAFLALVFFVIS